MSIRNPTPRRNAFPRVFAGVRSESPQLLCLCIASTGIVISSPKELKITDHLLWT